MYTEGHVEWMRALLDRLTDNGCWTCPCNNTTIQFDKPDMTYTYVAGDPEDPLNKVTSQVLEEGLGYRRRANV